MLNNYIFLLFNLTLIFTVIARLSYFVINYAYTSTIVILLFSLVESVFSFFCLYSYFFPWSKACFLSFFLDSYYFLGRKRVFFLFFLGRKRVFFLSFFFLVGSLFSFLFSFINSNLRVTILITAQILAQSISISNP